MSGLKTRILKVQYYLKHEFFAFDNVLLMLAGVCCLIWTWGSISSMTRNWSLAEEVMEREREKALIELEVETLELENRYYASPEYQELAARKYQNKVLPGEKMIYLPANSEEARHKHEEQKSTVAEAAPERTNLQKWAAFLFGI